MASYEMEIYHSECTLGRCVACFVGGLAAQSPMPGIRHGVNLWELVFRVERMLTMLHGVGAQIRWI